MAHQGRYYIERDYCITARCWGDQPSHLTFGGEDGAAFPPEADPPKAGINDFICSEIVTAQ